MYRKNLFVAVHYFVHLNLAISLLLGYVVFIFGIELGTSSKVCMYLYSWDVCLSVCVYNFDINAIMRLFKLFHVEYSSISNTNLIKYY